MDLLDTGDVTTPVDDPCQYNPAWRSLVAGYLFSSGVRTAEDFKSIAMTGSVTVTADIDVTVTPSDNGSDTENSKPKKRSSKKKAKAKPKKEVNRVHKRVYPFYDHPEYRPYASDKWIQSMVAMMDARISGNHLADEHVPFRLAERWYMEMDSEASMKKRIEPLLLTEATVDVITLDLLGVASARPAIEAYEKLYFNCRDENFNLSPSGQLIQRFAMPWGPLKTFLHKWEELDADGFCIQDGRPIAKDSDIWKAIAATMGYDALMYAWKWNRRAHGMKEDTLDHMIDISWKVSAMMLLSDMFTGNISHEDAARVLAAYTAQAKKISDDRNGRHTGDDNDTTKALMAVLYMTSPQMVEFDASDASARNEEIQSRIRSQLAINKQVIEDRGKQVEAEIVDAQIKGAIEGR